MDKTPLHLNMFKSTTVQTIGPKKVNIRTQGQESWRITIILAILSSREKNSIKSLITGIPVKYNQNNLFLICLFSKF